MRFPASAWVSLVLAAYMALLLYVAQDYSAKARLLPVFVTSVMLGMALLQFLGEISPTALRLMPFLNQKSLLVNDTTRSVSQDVRGVMAENRTEDSSSGDGLETGPEDDTATGWRMPVLSILSMAAFVALMHYTSFRIAVPVFLAAFLLGVARQGLLVSVGIAAMVGGLMFVLFDLVLNVRI